MNKNITKTVGILVVSLGLTECCAPGRPTLGPPTAATCDQVEGKVGAYYAYALSFPNPPDGKPKTGGLYFDPTNDPGLHHNISISDIAPPSVLVTLSTGTTGCSNGVFPVYSGGTSFDSWAFLSSGTGSTQFTVMTTKFGNGTATR